MNKVLSVAVLFIALVSIGCTSPWEKNFQPNHLVAEKFPPADHVDLRAVEFERLAKYEQAEKKMRVESSVSPEDWNDQQRLEAKNRLLEALQLPDRGNSIVILGWTRFVDTDQLDLRDPKLVEFAKKIGANVVVASTAYAGQVNQIVDYPLTSYSNYYSWGGRRGRFYNDTYTETTWVPMSVMANQ